MFLGKTKIYRGLDLSKLPNHVAIIMDGNGRWATHRGLPRKFGHKAGCENIKRITQNLFDLKVKVVTYFAFSTENWKRSEEEISNIFDLIRDYVKESVDEYVKNGVRITFCGDYQKLTKDIVNQFEKAKQQTKDCKNFVVNFAVNYGGRDEILRTVNKVKALEGEISAEQFESFLDTNGLPDPDFVIRTSGEQRISNFMLYQMAYSEFYFTKTYWPSFSNKDLQKALINFQKRKRRFGATK